METIKLSNGGSLPALGLGTWKSKPDKVTYAVEMAIKAGYRHIDCAAVYGNEKEVGQALKSCIGKTVQKCYGLILSDSLKLTKYRKKNVKSFCRAFIRSRFNIIFKNMHTDVEYEGLIKPSAFLVASLTARWCSQF